MQQGISIVTMLVQVCPLSMRCNIYPTQKSVYGSVFTYDITMYIHGDNVLSNTHWNTALQIISLPLLSSMWSLSPCLCSWNVILINIKGGFSSFKRKKYWTANHATRNSWNTSHNETVLYFACCLLGH